MRTTERRRDRKKTTRWVAFFGILTFFTSFSCFSSDYGYKCSFGKLSFPDLVRSSHLSSGEMPDDKKVTSDLVVFDNFIEHKVIQSVKGEDGTVFEGTYFKTIATLARVGGGARLLIRYYHLRENNDDRTVPNGLELESWMGYKDLLNVGFEEKSSILLLPKDSVDLRSYHKKERFSKMTEFIDNIEGLGREDLGIMCKIIWEAN